MKQLATIFLIVIVLLQTFSRFVVEADYLLNKSYIAKVLCINKDKPALHCNGKCCLARKLKEQEKQEQSSQTKKVKIEVQLYHLTEAVTLHHYQQQNKLQYITASPAQLSSFHHSIFHPPTV